MYREPDFLERREASAQAKAAMLARLKPKEAKPANEIIPWEEREAERIRALVRRPRKPKRTYEHHSIESDAPVSLFPPSTEVPKSCEGRPEPVRYSVEASVEFEAVIECFTPIIRRKGAPKAWRRRQWQEGNRTCYYCEVRMVMPTARQKRLQIGRPLSPRLATVDHKEPLARGGDDAPWNWVMACNGCNNRKGDMTEAEFRALLASEVAHAMERG